MLRVPVSSTAALTPNGVTPFWAFQEEGSMLGSTGNLLVSIPALGWESWRSSSLGARGQEPKRGGMPFPQWDAQLTAVKIFLYATG